MAYYTAVAYVKLNMYVLNWLLILHRKATGDVNSSSEKHVANYLT